LEAGAKAAAELMRAKKEAAIFMVDYTVDYFVTRNGNSEIMRKNQCESKN